VQHDYGLLLMVLGFAAAFVGQYLFSVLLQLLNGRRSFVLVSNYGIWGECKTL
jgi:hypothetical protein